MESSRRPPHASNVLLAIVLLAGSWGCGHHEGPLVEAPDPSGGAFSGDVILGRPTDVSVTASLSWDRDAEVWIECGDGVQVQPVSSPHVFLRPGVPANLELAGLRPGTRYVYRVRTAADGGAPATPNTFHTQRRRGSPFVFTVDADPHWGDAGFDAAVYGAAMTAIAADAPDFHLDLGDNFMTEKTGAADYAAVEHVVSGLRPFWALAGASVPLFLVIGNHEGEQGWSLDGTSDNRAVWATQARQAWYPNPRPGGFYAGGTETEPWIGVRDGYYAWEWGDALFVVLDPYWYTMQNPNRDFWNWTLGQAQYAWLARTLRESTAPFKFVFAHQLLSGIGTQPRGGVEAARSYEWGGLDADGTTAFAERRPGWGVPIHQLFVETGVTAFFHGHDHFFARQELDGITYQLVPQASYATGEANRSAAEYGYLSGVILGGVGYLRIGVAPSLATVEYVTVTADGADGVAYAYTLAPGAP